MSLSYQDLTLEFYIVFLLTIIFTFLFSFAISKRLTSPIRQLIKRANELSKGELKTRIYLETKDEFEDLARAFNQIAEDVEKSHAMVKKAHKLVGVKVKARTQELEETIVDLEQKLDSRTRELKKAVEEFEGFRKTTSNQD